MKKKILLTALVSFIGGTVAQKQFGFIEKAGSLSKKGIDYLKGLKSSTPEVASDNNTDASSK